MTRELRYLKTPFRKYIMPSVIKSRTEIFDDTIAQYSGEMLHFLYGRCNDWQIAEDLSQTMWAYVFRKFTPEAMLQKGLLYNKAKQVWIDYYRKVTRRPDLSFTDELPEAVLMPERREPESHEEDTELFERFWELFHPDEYDELDRMIFWLHERYGYSMIEISKHLGVSKSTAHERLTRLKEACLERLNSTPDTEEDDA